MDAAAVQDSTVHSTADLVLVERCSGAKKTLTVHGAAGDWSIRRQACLD